MIPDMEEVDVGEPDEAKKDPYNSDKDSKRHQSPVHIHCNTNYEIPPAQRLYLYRSEAIRFRVTGLQWQEIEPEAPSIRDRPRDLDPETGLPKELTKEEIQRKEAQREKEAGLRILVRLFRSLRWHI